MTPPLRAKPFVIQMRRGRLQASSCRHQQVDGLHRQSGRNASPSGIHTPSNIMSPVRNQPGSWTEIRLGARAQQQTQHDTPHTPAEEGGGRATNLSQTPAPPQARGAGHGPETSTREGLTGADCTDKESSWRDFATRGG